MTTANDTSSRIFENVYTNGRFNLQSSCFMYACICMLNIIIIFHRLTINFTNSSKNKYSNENIITFPNIGSKMFFETIFVGKFCDLRFQKNSNDRQHFVVKKSCPKMLTRKIGPFFIKFVCLIKNLKQTVLCFSTGHFWTNFLYWMLKIHEEPSKFF